MRPRTLLSTVLLSTTATVAWAMGPSAANLSPVSTATMGHPVPITLQLEGVSGGEPTVTLFYRNRSAKDWGKTTLKADSAGRYQGEIPATTPH